MFSNHVLRSSTAFTLISALLFPTLVEAGKTSNSKDMLGLESTGPKARTRVGEGPTSDIEKPKNEKVSTRKKRRLVKEVAQAPSSPSLTSLDRSEDVSETPPSPSLASSIASEDVDMEDTQIAPAQVPTELLTLPNETLRHIFSYLGTADLLRVRGTNCRFRDVISSMMWLEANHPQSPHSIPPATIIGPQFERNPVVFQFLSRKHNTDGAGEIRNLKSLMELCHTLYNDRDWAKRIQLHDSLWTWVLDPALNPEPLLCDLRLALTTRAKFNRLFGITNAKNDRMATLRGYVGLADRVLNHPANSNPSYNDLHQAIYAYQMVAFVSLDPQEQKASQAKTVELYEDLLAHPGNSDPMLEGRRDRTLSNAAVANHNSSTHEKDPERKLAYLRRSVELSAQALNPDINLNPSIDQYHVAIKANFYAGENEQNPQRKLEHYRYVVSLYLHIKNQNTHLVSIFQDQEYSKYTANSAFQTAILESDIQAKRDYFVIAADLFEMTFDPRFYPTRPRSRSDYHSTIEAILHAGTQVAEVTTKQNLFIEAVSLCVHLLNPQLGFTLYDIDYELAARACFLTAEAMTDPSAKANYMRAGNTYMHVAESKKNDLFLLNIY